jgi:hypothetical protein
MPPPLGVFVRRDNIHHRYYRRSGGGSDRSGKITLAFLLSAGGRIDLGGWIGGLDWIVVGGLNKNGLIKAVSFARFDLCLMVDRTLLLVFILR